MPKRLKSGGPQKPHCKPWWRNELWFHGPYRSDPGYQQYVISQLARFISKSYSDAIAENVYRNNALLQRLNAAPRQVAG